MFIVRDKTTHAVAAIHQYPPVFDAGGCLLGGVQMLGIVAELYESVEGDGPEITFVPGLLTYDGEWDVADGDAYAAAVEVMRPYAGQQAGKRSAVTALLDTKLAAGYPHDFGGEIGVKVLQTRDIHDRTNWLVSQASYGAAVAGGAGAVMGAAFRTEDNVNITLSYADGLNVLLAMAAWAAAHYARSWELKDAIADAADEAALDAIDITSGWPS